MYDFAQQQNNSFDTNARPSFLIYRSLCRQNIRGVPFVKPTLVHVLKGYKLLGSKPSLKVKEGESIFFCANSSVDMRNIPMQEGYMAVLIEFEHEDFNILKESSSFNRNFNEIGVSSILKKSIRQFIEWTSIADKSLWHIRRRELVILLDILGFDVKRNIWSNDNIVLKVQEIIDVDLSVDLDIVEVAERLAMSQSSLRRKLLKSGTSFTEIKTKIKLAYGLSQVQSTDLPIKKISQKCGYKSQSRFSQKFKTLFGCTPSELRGETNLNE